jgi:hypothetical protein
MEARPLRRGFGDTCFALFHQAGRVLLRSGQVDGKSFTARATIFEPAVSWRPPT